MADDDDRGALTLLWVVSVCVAVGFVFLNLIALKETDGMAAAFGFGGLLVGALLATTFHLARKRRPKQVATDRLDALVDRLQALETDQQRMAELEERVDFAERLLARVEGEAHLPLAGGDGRKA
jgi:hypothetical protein